MKILIVGRGVISTQYAWAFEKSGHTVEFYVRPGRKAEYGSSVALNLLDARKKITGVAIKEDWPVVLIEDFHSDHDYDLVFVSVQHYHFGKVAELLADKIGKATILLFNNFWEEPLEQVKLLPAEQLVWGFPQAGGGFDRNGVLNGSIFRNVTIGTFGTDPTARAVEVMAMFKSAGFGINLNKDFRSWLFGHFVVNAAIHIEILRTGLPMIVAFQTTKHWQDTIANGKELMALLRARNADISKSPDLVLLRVPAWLVSFGIRLAVKLLPPLRHSISAHSNIEEIKSYSRDVMGMAERLKIGLPRCEARMR